MPVSYSDIIETSKKIDCRSYMDYQHLTFFKHQCPDLRFEPVLYPPKTSKETKLERTNKKRIAQTILKFICR